MGISHQEVRLLRISTQEITNLAGHPQVHSKLDWQHRFIPFSNLSIQRLTMELEGDLYISMFKPYLGRRGSSPSSVNKQIQMNLIKHTNYQPPGKDSSVTFLISTFRNKTQRRVVWTQYVRQARLTSNHLPGKCPT